MADFCTCKVASCEDFAVNDYTCIVKRGVEVEVPVFVAEVLQHREEMLERIMELESKK